ncbi:MAG: hypothetical protein LUG99_21320 [Lachnospiraceae bacterium]|nr:hypothetical protein [Lachnospiraceae bacterium]
MNNQTSKGNQNSSLYIRLSKKEKQQIQKLAADRNLSVSEYIRLCSLNTKSLPIIYKAEEILPHLTNLSNGVNELTSAKGYDFKLTVDYILKEADSIWQCLK